MTATKLDMKNPYYNVLVILEKARSDILTIMGSDFETKLTANPEAFSTTYSEAVAQSIALMAKTLADHGKTKTVSAWYMTSSVTFLLSCIAKMTKEKVGALPIPDIEDATTFKLGIAHLGLLSGLNVATCPQAKDYISVLSWAGKEWLNNLTIESPKKLSERLCAYFESLTNEIERQELLNFVNGTTLTELKTKIQYAMNTKTVDTAATKLADVRKITNIWSLYNHASIVINERAKQVKRFIKHSINLTPSDSELDDDVIYLSTLANGVLQYTVRFKGEENLTIGEISADQLLALNIPTLQYPLTQNDLDNISRPRTPNAPSFGALVSHILTVTHHQQMGHCLMAFADDESINTDTLSKTKPTIVTFQKDGSSAYRLYEYHVSRKTCCAITMSEIPTLDNAPDFNHYFQSGFIRVKNESSRLNSLWYLDKTTKTLTNLSLSNDQLLEYDAAITGITEQKIEDFETELRVDNLKTDAEIANVLQVRRSSLVKIMGLSDIDFSKIQLITNNIHHVTSEVFIAVDLDAQNKLDPNDSRFTNPEYTGPSYDDIKKIGDLPFPEAGGESVDLPYDEDYSPVYKHTIDEYMKRSEKPSKSSAPTLVMVEKDLLASIATLDKDIETLRYFDDHFQGKSDVASYDVFLDQAVNDGKLMLSSGSYQIDIRPEEGSSDNSQNLSKAVLASMRQKCDDKVGNDGKKVLSSHESPESMTVRPNMTTVAKLINPRAAVALASNLFAYCSTLLTPYNIPGLKVSHDNQAPFYSATGMLFRPFGYNTVATRPKENVLLRSKQMLDTKINQLKAERARLEKNKELLLKLIEHEKALQAFEQSMLQWMDDSNQLVERLEKRLQATRSSGMSEQNDVAQDTTAQIKTLRAQYQDMSIEFNKLDGRMTGSTLDAAKDCEVRRNLLLKWKIRLGAKLVQLGEAQLDIEQQERELIAREKTKHEFVQILRSHTAMITQEFTNFQLMILNSKIIPWLSLVAFVIGAVAAIIAVGVLVGNPYFALLVVPAMASVSAPLCIAGATVGSALVAGAAGAMGYRFFAQDNKAGGVVIDPSLVTMPVATA
ncbi:MAG: hypothetical protein Q8R24_09905 [Legionellaceae bacterium]|nr:hypothetical protein [Legionellaceae bacterium]